LAEHELLEILLSDEHYELTFGILECIYIYNKITFKLDDPKMENSEFKHRVFLKEKAKFRSTIEIKD
jgi:hypothetical protein